MKWRTAQSLSAAGRSWDDGRSNGSRPADTRRWKYLLSGLLHCGLCGSRHDGRGRREVQDLILRASSQEKRPSVCSVSRGCGDDNALRGGWTVCAGGPH